MSILNNGETKHERHVFACLRVCSAGSRRQEARGEEGEDGVG